MGRYYQGHESPIELGTIILAIIARLYKDPRWSSQWNRAKTGLYEATGGQRVLLLLQDDKAPQMLAIDQTRILFSVLSGATILLLPFVASSSSYLLEKAEVTFRASQLLCVKHGIIILLLPPQQSEVYSHLDSLEMELEVGSAPKALGPSVVSMDDKVYKILCSSSAQPMPLLCQRSPWMIQCLFQSQRSLRAIRHF